MLPILLKLLLAFLCTGLLHLTYHFELDAAGHVVREQGSDIQQRTYKRDSTGRVFKEFLPGGKFIIAEDFEEQRYCCITVNVDDIQSVFCDLSNKIHNLLEQHHK